MRKLFVLLVCLAIAGGVSAGTDELDIPSMTIVTNTTAASTNVSEVALSGAIEAFVLDFSFASGANTATVAIATGYADGSAKQRTLLTATAVTQDTWCYVRNTNFVTTANGAMGATAGTAQEPFILVNEKIQMSAYALESTNGNPTVTLYIRMKNP